MFDPSFLWGFVMGSWITIWLILFLVTHHEPEDRKKKRS